MADRPTSDPSTGAVGELAHMHYPATNSVGAAPSNEFRPSRPGERRGGRAKGTPNRTTQTLKDAILAAADEAHPDGKVGYLKWLAVNNSTAFASLLGKVLPKEIEAGVNVRHTLEDLVLASMRHEPREAMAGQGNTSHAHAAQD
jgi:hypothetical protein